MQLLCNGVVLDLYDGTSLQFTHDNPLFAFDELKCERTTQFKLPSTPVNERVLELARIPAYVGTGMRRRFSAELQAGTVVKSGYLYVSEYDGTDYAAVFVTGELIDLQAVRDAGSIRDLLQYNNKFTWDDSSPTPASQVSLPNIGIVQYMVASGHRNPSVDLKWMMEEACQLLNVPITFPIGGSSRMRLMSTGDYYELNQTLIHLINDPDSSQDPVNIEPFLGLVHYQNVIAAVWDAVAYRDSGGLEWDYDNATLRGSEQFSQIYLDYDCVLFFPEDTPVNLCVVTGNLNMRSNGRAKEELTFIGTRSFSADGTYRGLPLAGTSVTIPANTPFFLADASGVVWTTPTTVGQQGIVGYEASLIPAYDVKVRISIDHQWVYGEAVPYNAILPDLTLIELLKIYAATNGMILSYSQADGVVFTPMDFSTFSVKEDVKITKRGSVARTFAKYAQRNVMRFDSQPSVALGERIVTAYYVDNDMIEAEKDLYLLKVSEGGYYGEMTQQDTVRQLLYIRDNADDDNDKQTIAEAKTDSANMQRVGLPVNASLQALCAASTQFVVEAHMNMMEYNAITAKTLLLIDGTKYTWTDRSWQNDVAKFTLAKV